MLRPRRLLTMLLIPLALLILGVTVGPVPDESASPAVTVEADTVDTKPLRLLMVGLAQDMARINTGLWHEDYDLIRQGASNIANHPKIPPAQMKAIKKELGSEFQNFIRFDKVVHGQARNLVTAAEARKWSDVLTTYTKIRDGCVGCHTAYRERVQPVLAPSK